MPQRRDHPYIWATWLPRLLTGENSCEWAIWFKANHQGWTRQPSEFDQAQWLLEHTALVKERIGNWEVGGYDVEVEAQNRFELRGKTATLAGRPDIIAHREDNAVIVDAKTGHESPSHAVQVMIPVRRSRGTATLPGNEAQRSGNLPGPYGACSVGGRGRQVHPEPRRAHPQALRRGTCEAGTQQPGMPLLRHHGRRLSTAR